MQASARCKAICYQRGLVKSQTNCKEQSMSDPQDLVCVYNATNPAKAELVRNLLEAEGIRAATGDTQGPFSGLAIAPSEVFVARSSEAAARAIIAQAEQSRTDDESVEEDELDEEESASS
jgi:hypothetical protein